MIVSDTYFVKKIEDIVIKMSTTAYELYLFQVGMITSMALANELQLPDQWLNAIVPCLDEFMVAKLALKKSTYWKSEKEWRLFDVINDMMLAQEEYSHIELRPSAVYNWSLKHFSRQFI